MNDKKKRRRKFPKELKRKIFLRELKRKIFSTGAYNDLFFSVSNLLELFENKYIKSQRYQLGTVEYSELISRTFSIHYKNNNKIYRKKA